MSRRAAVAMLAMTTAGAREQAALFSACLTFLEPFVIGASCLWCLSSALLMTGLHVLAWPDGQAALGQWRQRGTARRLSSHG